MASSHRRPGIPIRPQLGAGGGCQSRHHRRARIRASWNPRRAHRRSRVTGRRGSPKTKTSSATRERHSVSAVQAGCLGRVRLTRPIGDGAALAFPSHVPSTGARDIEDEKVSGQQPVTTRTALGWSIHPLRLSAAHQLANLSSHTDHILSPLLGNPGRFANCDYSVVSHPACGARQLRVSIRFTGSAKVRNAR